MKTIITTTVISASLFLTSCGNSSHEKGTCPICKMDLELVSKENEHKHHDH